METIYDTTDCGFVRHRSTLCVLPSLTTEKEQTGAKPAKLLKKLKQNIDKPIAAILSLNTITHAVGAADVGANYRCSLTIPSAHIIRGIIIISYPLVWLSEDKFDMKLADIVRPFLTFPENAPVSNIWEKMQEKKDHISIIIDEYGTLRCIVTMKDIIETALGFEIVGERNTVTDMQTLARERWQKRRAEVEK